MLRHVLAVFILLAPGLHARQGVRIPPPFMPQMQGIDVSHHQKKIDWNALLANEPVEFAFVKATEGANFTDTLFNSNWTTLRQVGLRRGAYHFFRAYGCGEDQARHFLSTVDMQAGDLAPVLDIELLDGVPPEILVEEAKVWLQQVESQLNIKPIIYTNQHFYESFLAGHFDEYPLWIARYAQDKPVLTRGRRWQFWQYSNEGCIEGISSKVDMNVFPGTPEALEAFSWYPTIEIATEALGAP